MLWFLILTFRIEADFESWMMFWIIWSPFEVQSTTWRNLVTGSGGPTMLRSQCTCTWTPSIINLQIIVAAATWIFQSKINKPKLYFVSNGCIDVPIAGFASSIVAWIIRSSYFFFHVIIRSRTSSGNIHRTLILI